MHKEVTINGASAYHAYPDDGEPRKSPPGSRGKQHPGLILIEEIWGVNAHVRNVADRFAGVGYSVLAPELLPGDTLAQLTPQMQIDLFDPEKRAAMQPQMREMMGPIYQPEFAQGAIAALKAGVDYLINDSGVNGNVAVLGFCFGGTYSFHLAAHDKRIKAAVPFYGQPPTEEEIPNIKCPILAFYGEEDERLIETLPALKQSMQKHGKQFEAVAYPNAGHAFFNDTNSRQYRKDIARDAWDKALAFLREHVS